MGERYAILCMALLMQGLTTFTCRNVGDHERSAVQGNDVVQQQVVYAPLRMADLWTGHPRGTQRDAIYYTNRNCKGTYFFVCALGSTIRPQTCVDQHSIELFTFAVRPA